MENNNEQYCTYRDHEHFSKRMQDENDRQNARIAELEKSVKEINTLTINIERLATSVQHMTAEIVKHGERLEDIEAKPAKRWDAMIGAIIGAVAAALCGAVMAGVLR